MSQHVKRYYSKEEEFLTECHLWVHAAAQLMGNDWLPDGDCNDSTRENRQKLFADEQCRDLFFNGATLYRDANEVTSIVMTLKSSHRTVSIMIDKRGRELNAKKVFDGPVLSK